MPKIECDRNNMSFQGNLGNCRINGVQFDMEAKGVVAPAGTYTLNLKMTDMPPNFHPILMTTYVYSVSCNSAPGVFFGGLSFIDMGIGEYTATREISFDEGGVIKVESGSNIRNNTISIDGTVNGDFSFSKETSGLAFYREKVRPNGPGSIVSVARGGILNKDLSVCYGTIRSRYDFDKSISMPKPNSRHVTEHGELKDGNVYDSRLTSIVFREEGDDDTNVLSIPLD